MQWHTLARRPVLHTVQNITMEDLLELRSAWMTGDLDVVPPGWAQPQYQQRTKTLLTNTMATVFWNNRVSDDLLFGDLVIILLPDNSCSLSNTPSLLTR